DVGFVTGTGVYRGGVTASTGTSKTAVRDRNARADGVVGGTGKKPAPPAPPKVDLSRELGIPADLQARLRTCPFPPEADVEQINQMKVSLMVTVGADGRLQSASVLNDPGFGFGRQAYRCLMRFGKATRFPEARDSSGKPIPASTRVSFRFA